MKKKSIMIIDDSEADQLLTRCIIENYNPNIEIHQAYDGEEALEKLTKLEEKPELILLDINMSRMGGFDFLEEYSKNNDSSMVVVMLSSSDRTEDKDNALKYPCVKDYVTKSISIGDLENLLN